jgi:predicted ATPase
MKVECAAPAFAKSCSQCLGCVRRFGPVVLLFDDLHHFDTMSWQLLVVLCADLMEGCMLVTTMRDHDGTLDAERYQAEDKVHIHQAVLDSLEALLDTPNMYHMQLEGFSQAEVRQVMQMMLPNVVIHESNVEAILQQTGGHPVHLEQIVFYLESLGDGAADTLAKPDGLLSSNLAQLAASSMTHLILARVDWLRPAQQLTLKVCSVLGPTVRLPTLLSTFPLSAADSSELTKQLRDDLVALCSENFLDASTGQPDVWVWQSTVARDTIYDMIPFNQRRLLHARLAEALENAAPASFSFPRSHIAYHWTKSCVSVEAVEVERTLRAIRCWKEAAAEMDLQGQYLDAVRFMSKSLAICELLIVAHKSEQAASSSELKRIGTLDVAQQYKFKADVYFKLVMSGDTVRTDCTKCAQVFASAHA